MTPHHSEMRHHLFYQGIQHYESVDFFGGKEALEHRQKLDARKRQLCADNGVSLLAWPYTDEISSKKLNTKIMAIKKTNLQKLRQVLL